MERSTEAVEKVEILRLAPGVSGLSLPRKEKPKRWTNPTGRTSKADRVGLYSKK